MCKTESPVGIDLMFAEAKGFLVQTIEDHSLARKDLFMLINN